MGIVTGLDLIHNKTTSGVFKKDSETMLPIVSQLHAKPFTVAELYPKLEEAFKNNTEYTLKRISESELQIEERHNELMTLTYTNYTISEENNSLRIKSRFLTPLFYELLSDYATKGHEVVIDWQGKHPFFTTKTIKNYKGGHYHYACKVPIKQLISYVSGVFKEFKSHNAFWDITIFHQDFSIEINNYSCAIYEDDASVLPEHQAFCMIINEPQIQFKTIDLEISEGGSYYFNDKSPDEIMTVLKAMLSELKAQGTKGFLTVFNPICQSYYEISATINSLGIKEELIDRLLSSCSFVNQNKVTHILKRLPDGTIDIEGTYQQNSTPMGITITDDDLFKGDCYFDKFYNHQVFETLLTTIAKHFCACFLSCWELLEENGLDIYYHNQEDKKRIATHFKNLEGFEDYEVRFVAV